MEEFSPYLDSKAFACMRMSETTSQRKMHCFVFDLYLLDTSFSIQHYIVATFNATIKDTAKKLTVSLHICRKLVLMTTSERSLITKNYQQVDILLTRISNIFISVSQALQLNCHKAPFVCSSFRCHSDPWLNLWSLIKMCLDWIRRHTMNCLLSKWGLIVIKMTQRTQYLYFNYFSSPAIWEKGRHINNVSTNEKLSRRRQPFAVSFNCSRMPAAPKLSWVIYNVAINLRWWRWLSERFFFFFPTRDARPQLRSKASQLFQTHSIRFLFHREPTEAKAIHINK